MVITIRCYFVIILIQSYFPLDKLNKNFIFKIYFVLKYAQSIDKISLYEVLYYACNFYLKLLELFRLKVLYSFNC